MRRPPDAPTASRRPSDPRTIVGVMLLRPERFGSTELGRPGTGSNQNIPLFQTMPVSPATISEPQELPSVLVSDTSMPSASAVQRWVVEVSDLWRSSARAGSWNAQASPAEGRVAGALASIWAARVAA